MSHLPRYDGTTPESNDYGHMNDNNEEKKDNNYLPSEGVYVGADGDGPREEETIRALKPRQISMIAIGGAIGTGLVIASGRSLARSGPGSLFISYVVMGIV
jgi:amino acid transporter